MAKPDLAKPAAAAGKPSDTDPERVGAGRFGGSSLRVRLVGPGVGPATRCFRGGPASDPGPVPVPVRDRGPLPAPGPGPWPVPVPVPVVARVSRSLVSIHASDRATSKVCRGSKQTRTHSVVSRRSSVSRTIQRTLAQAIRTRRRAASARRRSKTQPSIASTMNRVHRVDARRAENLARSDSGPRGWEQTSGRFGSAGLVRICSVRRGRRSVQVPGRCAGCTRSRPPRRSPSDPTDLRAARPRGTGPGAVRMRLVRSITSQGLARCGLVVVDSIDPTDRADSTDPIHPTDSTGSTDSTESTDSTDWSDVGCSLWPGDTVVAVSFSLSFVRLVRCRPFVGLRGARLVLYVAASTGSFVCFGGNDDGRLVGAVTLGQPCSSIPATDENQENSDGIRSNSRRHRAVSARLRHARAIARADGRVSPSGYPAGHRRVSSWGTDQVSMECCADVLAGSESWPARDSPSWIRSSSTRSPTPTTMKLSARLKSGHE